MSKVLVCLHGNDVTPRFDLTTEVLIAVIGESGEVREERTLVLPQASAEKLCHMILTEDVRTVICGGIEEEYYQYLAWKRVTVIDSVIGRCEEALQRYREGALEPGQILVDRGRLKE
ncbi:MAG: NifB/NifX family molybdenum-iron cluster-binding protein [Syntrophobacteraceae bacterium]|jgi:predicted Fe-Mo cluster-binding NifX family protein|nr:NifB/NifX family molybdenum-iron cluster-binding protein [Syntrophobacteraceae bacterium]